MSPQQSQVQITLTADEALVLFEFLQRFSETGKLEIEDQAEERVLWALLESPPSSKRTATAADLKVDLAG